MTKIINEPKSILESDHLVDPDFSPNAIEVLNKRYLTKDENGEIIETPKEMLIRVATAVAKAETDEEAKHMWATVFYDMMADGVFIPNSPTLMNAGRRMGMLSACFVLPVEDNIDGIFDSIKSTALVQKAGGGTGFSFNNLRPNGSIVKSSGGTTAGPLSFIDVFSEATSAIQQGAFRRGANMGILKIDHPDIIDFIKAKEDLSRWQNYNVSISITNDWMKALKENPLNLHEVYHPEWGCGELWQKTDRKTEKLTIRAFKPSEEIGFGWEHWTIGDTWNLICERAWSTGEPGLFFKDKANEKNVLMESCGPIEATNPCGEQPLHPYDSCTLGSINLSKFYDSNEGSIDWNSLENTIESSVRFLDNVVEVNNYPLKEIMEMSKDTSRRIGLGVMGWADLLFAMDIPYNSNEARELAFNFQDFITMHAERFSEGLAHEKGTFGAWKTSTFGKAKRLMRNAFHTTVAPTGTISIIANCSGGIEPLYALSFKREVMPDDSGNFVLMEEHNPYWKEAISKAKLDKGTKEALLKHAIEYGNIQGYDSTNLIVTKLKELFVTSHDIEPNDHIDMQAAWQKRVSTSISKTINLSKESSVEDVKSAYMRAYDKDCVGITVYRDGCREGKSGMKQPMKVDFNQKSKKTENLPLSLNYNDEMLPATRTKIKTQFGNLHVTIVRDTQNDKEIEIFAQLGKAGDLIAADIEAICRLSSKLLRLGSTLDDVIDQLEYIGTTHIMPSEYGKITSMPDALAKAMKKYSCHKKDVELKRVSNGKERTESEYGVACPSCGAKLSFQEGCMKCQGCGYSAC